MAQRLSTAVSAPPSDTDFQRFRGTFLENASERDQSDLDIASLDRLARAFWDFAATRKPDETKLRVRTEPDMRGERQFSVLEFVTDDKPFIVASVLAELANFDVATSWVGHPIVAIERNEAGDRTRLVATREELRGLANSLPGVTRESMMQVAFEREIEASDAALLETRTRKVLSDVETVVADWRPMLAKLDESIAEIAHATRRMNGEAADEAAEAAAFLEWLQNNHFIFTGVRDYACVETPGGIDLEPDLSTGLGVLRDQTARVLRRDARSEAVSPPVAAFLASPGLLTINKSNFRSTVHRPVYMDYVGVKRFDASGKPSGERRFLGLFTSAAYNRLPEEIPILRRKFKLVLERANFANTSYNYNTLVNILETYPRDELFQIAVDDLYEISTGIMRLTERPRTRLFVRWDRYDRFVSAMVFVPRDRYAPDLRERIGNILKEAYDGRLSAFYPQLGDGALTRLHFIIGRNNTQKPSIDANTVERRISDAVRSWRDQLHDALVRARGEEAAHLALSRFGDAFSVAYRDQFGAQDAISDVAQIEQLGAFPAVGISIYRREGDSDTALRIKLYRRSEPITLSKSLPIFEHLGLSVINEFSYRLTPGPMGAQELVHLHDFLLIHPKGEKLDLAALKAPIESAFPAVWLGQAEDDGFNRLIIEARLPWQEVSILRAFARYLVQTGSSLSQPYMEEALAANAPITRLLLDLFHTRFNPATNASLEHRASDAKSIEEAILKALEGVQSLDQDRILRRFLNLIQSALRTNYYQRSADGTARSALAIKLSSKLVEGLPEPRPNVEIFVYSPRFEGVHLRFGPVARGGIRWSDRREDFRTEVLGLVKAQYVKNAVIVPVGAKGGFVPKRLAADMSREDVAAEGVACYKQFITSLLELTDNLDIKRPDAPPMRPAMTLCHDGPDPYLVVAADKGTATFSDIANGIAIEKKFWLGDAFASGGSNGYDHKAMGITAKGAWEAVKRHFREFGTDIQTTPFTVIGVGDMSGDVFGNGMLLSRQIKLLAAFDHRDIFIDPNPDPEKSFKERERLFALPRSSWQDYDTSLISPGGGCFSRKLKSIPLTKEMQELLGVSASALSPFELMRNLLTAKTDLLWFGGIGTYIKAQSERNADVGDTANDTIRVDGEDVRAKVVGEGANLGCTQKGRIAFALKGGRINTDAIDNSAGVDCSDHEVNIKILLDAAVAQDKLDPSARNQLLKDMTGDVAAHVLLDNYNQTLALSLAEAVAKDEIDSQARFIRLLEREGRLKREVEKLPSDDEIQERKAAGLGLTRPEIAVLLAYCKLKTFDELVGSNVPDDPALLHDLIGYFPPVLEQRFPDQLRGHRLRREIIATSLSNEMANIGGVNYASRLRELSGADTAEVAGAYSVVCDVFDILALRAMINALDGKIETAVQTAMHTGLRTFLRRQTIWFLRRGEQAHAGIAPVVARYKPLVSTLRAKLKDVSSNFVRAALERRESELVSKGVPRETAFAVASFEPLFGAGDIVYLAIEAGVPVETAARGHALIGESTGLEKLFTVAIHLTSSDHWERLAIRRIVEDFTQQQAVLASIALKPTKPDREGIEAVAAWLSANAGEVKRIASALEELEGGTGLTAARLSLAVGHVRDLVTLARTQQKI